jgi:hypothetical protein
MGTGEISKKIRQLLGKYQEEEAPMHLAQPSVTAPIAPPPPPQIPSPNSAKQTKKKLFPLLPYVDWALSNAENARRLITGKCEEFGIQSTPESLANFVGIHRRKQPTPPKPPPPPDWTEADEHAEYNPTPPKEEHKDISVEMLDMMIAASEEMTKNLKDMRQHLLDNVGADKKQLLVEFQMFLEAKHK